MKRFNFANLSERIRLSCFEWSVKHAKLIAIITSFIWLICAIAAGARA